MGKDLDGRGKGIIGLEFCLPNPGGGAWEDCSRYCRDYRLRWSCREWAETLAYLMFATTYTLPQSRPIRPRITPEQ